MMPRPAPAFLTFVLAITACQPLSTLPAGTAAPATTTPGGPPGTASPPTTGTPPLEFVEVSIVPGEGFAPAQVIGLARNDSSLALQDVSLQVELFDVSGASLGTVPGRLLLGTLQPKARSPFVAFAPPGTAPVSALPRLVDFTAGPRVLSDARVESVSAHPSAEGVSVLGLVRNQGRAPVRIQQLAVVWRNRDGGLAGAVLAEAPGGALLPGETFPWRASPTTRAGVSDLESYLSVAPVTAPVANRLELADPPTWYLTAQGKGFVAGGVRNIGLGAEVPEVVVALWAQGELVGLQILRSPVPLLPGETLAFGAEDFAPLDEALRRLGIGPEEVTPSVIVDSLTLTQPSPAPFMLSVSVKQFEVIGSRVYLRGSLEYNATTPLAGLAIYVALRSTSGELQSASWQILPPLDPGRAIDFAVDLPLPAGIEPEMTEIDLRALGMPVTP